MITLDSSVRPADDVVDTLLDGDRTALLHLVQKTYYSLNATGTLVWNGLKNGETLREIGRALQDAYEVDGATADASVLRIVSELADCGLVEP